MPRDELIYKNILENMKDGVMTIDLKGRIITFNNAAEDILCLKAEEMIGKPFAEVFLGQEENDAFNQTILNAIYDAETTHNALIEFHIKNRVLHLAVTTSFLQAQEGKEKKNVALIVVFNDITELEKLREQEKRLTEELKSKHKELQKAYLNLEGSNKKLGAALRHGRIIRILAVLFLLILLAAGGGYFRKNKSLFPSGTKKKKTVKTEKTASLNLFPIKSMHLKSSISVTGELKPIKVVNITSPFTGVVKEIYFQYGQMVEQGQLLLEMDTYEVEINYRDAEAAYIKALNYFRVLEAWENSEEVSNAKRSISKAKMNLEAQKQKLEETEELYKKGIIPESEYKNVKMQLNYINMDYDAASEALNNTLSKGDEENIKVARLELKNAEIKMKDLKKQLDLAVVSAPVSGTIIIPDLLGDKEKNKGIEKGSSINHGEILLSIGDLSGLSVTTFVDEIEVAKLKKGQKVDVTGDAFPGICLDGEVFSVASQAIKGEKSGGNPTFEILIAVRDIPSLFKKDILPGMSTKIDIIVYDKKEALTLPINAIIIEGEKRFVMKKDEQTGELLKTEVKTGIITLDSVEITEGLKDGEVVALSTP